jgi:hypothetical protein
VGSAGLARVHAEVERVPPAGDAGPGNRGSGAAMEDGRVTKRRSVATSQDPCSSRHSTGLHVGIDIVPSKAGIGPLQTFRTLEATCGSQMISHVEVELREFGDVTWSSRAG